MSITEQQVMEAQAEWGKCIASRDLQTLLSLYSERAVLKPTLSNHLRTSTEDIKLYFIGSEKFSDTGFFNNGFTEVKFLESETKCQGEMAVSVGSYEFMKAGESTKAHFTYLYTLEDGSLKILSHHSSLFI